MAPTQRLCFPFLRKESPCDPAPALQKAGKFPDFAGKSSQLSRRREFLILQAKVSLRVKVPLQATYKCLGLRVSEHHWQC
jgi:hypothetical protein